MSQEEFGLCRLFQMNLRDLITRETRQQPFEITLDGIYFDSLGSFLVFMKSFDCPENDQKRGLKVDIVAFLRSKLPKKSDVKNQFSRHFTLESKTLSVRVSECSQQYQI